MRPQGEMEKELDVTTLAGCDGREGRPAYVAAAGRVVDVTASPLWKGGRHMGRHEAGRDLSAELAAAPHGPEVLDRYPRVGRPGRRPEGAALPPFVAAVLARCPLLARHPHPATVHFPIAFSAAAAFFSVLYVLTRRPMFEATAFCCLVGTLVLLPLAIVTGFATWRINYRARPMRHVTIKQNLSFAAVLDIACACAWRACVPTVLDGAPAAVIVYLLLVVAQAPALLAVAYYGGTLTFPMERE